MVEVSGVWVIISTICTVVLIMLCLIKGGFWVIDLQSKKRERENDVERIKARVDMLYTAIAAVENYTRETKDEMCRVKFDTEWNWKISKEMNRTLTQLLIAIREVQAQKGADDEPK